MRHLAPLRAHLRRNSAAYTVLGVGLVVTVLATRYMAEEVRDEETRRFDESVERITSAIENRMNTYVDVLHATRGLFEASESVERDEFAAFVESLRLRMRYPGIQGIGYAVLVPKDQLKAHEAAVRAEGFPNYHVWPEGDRDVITSILYLEPFDWRNQRAFGFDMFSEPLRRAAMSRARDTGQAVASAPVVLLQEAGAQRQAGFLIYLPVYEGEIRPATTAERRARLEGWAYAVFRAGDLFRGIFPEQRRSKVEFEIFGGPELSRKDLLYDTDGRIEALSGGLRHGLDRTVNLHVAGRDWTLFLTTQKGFADPSARVLPWLVLLGGLLVSGLLYWVTRQEVSARAQAESAERRAAFLADASDLLSRSLDLDVTLESLTRLAVPFLADMCAASLREGEGYTRLVAVTHVNASDTDRLRAFREGVGPQNGGFGVPRVLATGRPELHPQIDERGLELASGGRGPFFALLRDLDVRSAIFVPLGVRGETIGVLVFMTSVSQRRYGPEDLRLAEDLARRAALAVDNARLYREAQRAVHVRDEFLSVASHELKTPLTSLHLQAQGLVRMVREGRLPTPDRVERTVGSIDRQVARLNNLINELLDVSRITAGRLDFEIEEVDLGAVVHGVLEHFDDDLKRAGCTVVTRFDEDVRGRWDPIRLEQVVVNLLSNAMKYGAGRPIHVTVAREDDEAVLSVRDQGMGIAPDDLVRIFGRFERAAPLRNFGGLGLGLWIVRQIVEGLGGGIDVESELDRGSTFTVHLPLAQAEEAAGSD